MADLIHKFSTLPPLILASQSPRRRELLSKAGFPFSIIVRDVAEIYPSDLPLNEVGAYLSGLKAQAYHVEAQTALIITADTIVLLDSEILGKPEDEADARKMLKKLSGRVHQVYTGVTLRYQNIYTTFTERTDVFFRELKEDEIVYYVSAYQPMDKAGAYGVQEWIGLHGVEKIVGDFYNIMGLPVFRLGIELARFSERLALNPTAENF